MELEWQKIVVLIYIHIGAFVGFWYLVTAASIQSITWMFFLVLLSLQAGTVGTHRLWSHRSFKAKLPLSIYLATGQTMAFQRTIYQWVRDHRTHHKYSDTDADPHNASRGFFYSHIGWLLVKKPDVVIKHGRKIDLSDLEADPVVMFQKKYYHILMVTTTLFTALVPWYFWRENFSVAWHVCVLFRNFVTLHISLCGNSVAHMWGNKPYDKNILPVENMLLTYFTLGDGYHNYHHTFPWDYRTAELGPYYGNWNTMFIDFMAKIGQAYDLKCASVELIEKTASKTGDGSRNWGGWEDKDMEKDDVKMAKMLS